MDISSGLTWATIKLQKKNIPSARLDAEVLLSVVLKKPKEFLFIYSDHQLKPLQIKKFQTLIAKRAAYQPVAYLTGHKEFFGLDFLINKNVLVPRPETELIVELATDLIKQNNYSPLTLIDVGTGSGCIIISLKKNNPQIKATGIDSSRRALALAQKNAQKHQVRINFLSDNLLASLPPLKGAYAIIANLPYLAQTDKLTAWEKKSISHEPRLALYGGKKGWEQYEKLFKQIHAQKTPPLFIIVEINPLHWRPMQTLAKKYFPDRTNRLSKDLSGRRRILIIS